MTQVSTTPSIQIPHALPSPRLDYLDGIRGLAALYVVVHHVYLSFDDLGTGGKLPSSIAHLSWFFSHGRRAVDIFIVLSGFVLMLPIVRSKDRFLRGGTLGFLMRRSKRILPPYFLALITSILLLTIFPAMRHATENDIWKGALPGLTTVAIATHGLLVQHLSKVNQFQINNPLWSVSLEYHIYFLLPFVFLPLWRRVGGTGIMIPAIVLGVVPWLLFGRFPLSVFVSLFALGLLAAVIAFTPRGSNSRLGKIPFGLLATSLICAILAWTIWQPGAAAEWMPHLDLATGLASMCFLVWINMNLRDTGMRHLLRKFLGSAPLERLGVFSYSLYLIHMPLIAAALRIVQRFIDSAAIQFVLTLCVGTPVIVAISYGFHLWGERPFMSLPKGKSSHGIRRQELVS
jgi:peptidoglycan/LPS O-acetylase OafA/YrhL